MICIFPIYSLYFFEPSIQPQTISLRLHFQVANSIKVELQIECDKYIFEGSFLFPCICIFTRYFFLFDSISVYKYGTNINTDVFVTLFLEKAVARKWDLCPLFHSNLIIARKPPWNYSFIFQLCFVPNRSILEWI